MKGSGQLIDAVASGRAWLEHTFAERSLIEGINTRAMLYFLVGHWLCLRILGKGVSSECIATIASTRLCGAHEDVTQELLQCDAALVAFSAAILRAYNLQIPVANDLLDEVKNILCRNEPRNQETYIRTFPLRFLLSKSKVDITTDDVETCRVAQASYTELVMANENDIDEVLCLVASATLYGQRSARLSAVQLQRLRSVLPIWMLHALQRYDLVGASHLLRGMRYLDLAESKAYHDGLVFLLAQQQTDGRFGFLGPEEHELKTKGRQFDSIVDLHLPVTLASLWTFGEAIDSKWSLYQTI